MSIPKFSNNGVIDCYYEKRLNKNLLIKKNIVMRIERYYVILFPKVNGY